MEEKYSVIELAELVGVPRTTINDWLNKYSPYIEFIMQGKRRIYTQNTLMVLKKVQELRNQGISCTDIESQLSTQFAVHPVPQDDLLKDLQNNESSSSTAEKEESLQNQRTSEMPDPSAGQVPSCQQTEAGEYALIAQKHSEEIARAVADRFQEMLQKVDQMELDSKKSSRRIRTILVITVLLQLLLGGVTGLSLYYGIQTESKTRIQQKSLDSMSASAKTREQTLQHLSDHTGKLQQSLEQLEKKLAEEQKVFAQTLKENRENYEAMKQDALKRQEAEFAVERETLKQEKRNLIVDSERISQDHEAYITELKKEIQNLKDQLNDKKTQIK